MAYRDRVNLIEQIEKERQSRVITFVTGDRGIAPTMIADDSLRPLYDHLRQIRREEGAKVKKIDLFLYSRGGHVETPWKLVTKIRGFCEEFSVIVPSKAHSAATMIALGADQILTCTMTELGPIDPAMQVDQRAGGKFLLPELGVEDVAAYLTFLKDRARLTDQAALAETVKSLAEHLTPTLLGRVERTYSHIRLVARKLLSLHKPPLADAAINSITEALTEKMYAHGHGIAHDEAKEMGLPAVPMTLALEELSWRILEDYEDELRLLETVDPNGYFADDQTNVYREDDAIGVCMESRAMAHVFSGSVQLERVRQLPPQLNLNMNINLQLPAGVNLQDMPPQSQQLLQELVQQALRQAQQTVQAEVAKLAPVQGISARWVGGRWKQLRM